MDIFGKFTLYRLPSKDNNLILSLYPTIALLTHLNLAITLTLCPHFLGTGCTKVQRQLFSHYPLVYIYIPLHSYVISLFSCPCRSLFLIVSFYCCQFDLQNYNYKNKTKYTFHFTHPHFFISFLIFFIYSGSFPSSYSNSFLSSSLSFICCIHPSCVQLSSFATDPILLQFLFHSVSVLSLLVFTSKS